MCKTCKKKHSEFDRKIGKRFEQALHKLGQVNMKRYPSSLVIWKMQLKTPVKYYLYAHQMGKHGKIQDSHLYEQEFSHTADETLNSTTTKVNNF